MNPLLKDPYVASSYGGHVMISRAVSVHPLDFKARRLVYLLLRPIRYTDLPSILITRLQNPRNGTYVDETMVYSRYGRI